MKKKEAVVPVARGAMVARDASEKAAEDERKKDFEKEKEEIKQGRTGLTQYLSGLRYICQLLVYCLCSFLLSCQDFILIC
jgi:hypothetical protein